MNDGSEFTGVIRKVSGVPTKFIQESGRNNRADGTADRVGQDLYAGPVKRKTTGQITGIEANAPAPDSVNGFLEGPGVNMAHVAPDFGVPTEGSGWAAKQRAILREMNAGRRTR